RGGAVRTDCTEEQLVFQELGGRQVVARFDGGRITSDAGILLLREVAERTGLLRRFAQCFTDYRDPELIEHTVEELVAQRVLALACGYEDLNDHDVLRDDALLAVAAGKRDATGATRKRVRDRGHALAGKSTLNRLEGTPAAATAAARYKKIVYDGAAIEAWFVEAFLAAHPAPPAEIVLDLDATDDPLHGQQEGRFFHGYYRAYCYLPLYIFAGDFLLAAKLRRASGDGAAGAVEEVARIVGQLRAQWPGVRIVVRGDSGFARDAVMTGRAGSWKTGSRSSSSGCLRIGRAPPPCGPTSCGCGFPRWPTCWSRRCAGWGSRAPRWRGHRSGRFGRGCSSWARW